VQIRSTAQAVPCTITNVCADQLRLIFDEPQSSVAPGQAAVLYSDDMVVGGGWIEAGDNRMDSAVSSLDGEGCA
jgi:tRNA-uridine 2-sulfurtransferase